MRGKNNMKKIFIVIILLCMTIKSYASFQGSASLDNLIIKTLPSTDMYFCTAADKEHFHLLLHLIGSLHGSNFDDTKQIAVFDLGLTPEQRTFLARVKKVSVYKLEITHPDLLKHFQTRPWNIDNGKMVRGLYAWKPVVIKQALEMFPYILYLDAGTAVLKSLRDVFYYIQEKGYFLLQQPSEKKAFVVGNHCTNYIKNKFQLNTHAYKWILKKPDLLAGIQGLSRAMYNDYVLPLYALSKDLKNFEDDGSCSGGFGWARHDQTLFGIHAYLLGLQPIFINKQVEFQVGNRKCLFKAGRSMDAHIFYHFRIDEKRYGKKLDVQIRFKS